MKYETLPVTLQEQKGVWKNTMNNCVPVNYITEVKCTNSQKYTNYQNWVQERIDNLNIPIISKKIELGTK